MRPLIVELKELWEGIPAHDILNPPERRVFKLRAAVLYTTYDFPGYGTVSGASLQGYTACPLCGDQLRGRYAYESRKITYRDARRWTRIDHEIRSPRYNKFFDGHNESRSAPVPKTPAQQRAALDEYHKYLSQRAVRTASARERRGSPSVTMDHRRTHQPGNAEEGRSNSAANMDSAVGDELNVDQDRAVRTSRKRRKKSTSHIDRSRASTSHSLRDDEEGLQARSQPRRHTSSIARTTKPTNPSKISGIKRGSIFFELPY